MKYWQLFDCGLALDCCCGPFLPVVVCGRADEVSCKLIEIYACHWICRGRYFRRPVGHDDAWVVRLLSLTRCFYVGAFANFGWFVAR